MARSYRALAVVIVFIALVGGLSLVQRSAANDPPSKPGVWYKGNLHTHSLWSDGNDFPEMIADWYHGQGYNFLALSDHNILSQGDKWIEEKQILKRGAINGVERYRARFGEKWVETREKEGVLEVRLKKLEEFRPLVEEDGKFIMIQGEEISDNFGAAPIHVNATHIHEVIRPQGGGSVREVIDNNLKAVEDQSRKIGRPIFAHLNHPNFGYAVTAEDIAAVEREKFFEVYNGHPSVHNEGDHHHASTDRIWDIANTIRVGEMKAPPLMGLGTDDSHTYFGGQNAPPGRGWVMVRAEALTAEAIVNALKAGDFYASSGVTLRDAVYDESGKTYDVWVAPEEGVTYKIAFVGTREGYDHHHEPVKDEKGEVIRTTEIYSDDVGATLAEFDGPHAQYRLKGDELYVRAIITSSKPPASPAWKGQKSQAWTQPVGWQSRVK